MFLHLHLHVQSRVHLAGIRPALWLAATFCLLSACSGGDEAPAETAGSVTRGNGGSEPVFEEVVERNPDGSMNMQFVGSAFDEPGAGAEAFLDEFKLADLDGMQQVWARLTPDERGQALRVSMVYAGIVRFDDAGQFAELAPAIELLESVDVDALADQIEPYAYDDDFDDPLEGYTLDLPYPEQPYSDDERILGRFMKAFERGDLDGVVDAWSQMGPEQRLEALDRGRDYRFSIPYDDDDALDAVQDTFDLIGRADIGKLQADAEGSSVPPDYELSLPDELGSVRGIVVDADTGEPVAGVSVAATHPALFIHMMTDEASRWGTLTAADGSFEIGDIPTGNAILMLQLLPEYNIVQHEFVVVADEASFERVELPKLQRLELALPTFLTGVVTDSQTGEPVAGVLVGTGGGWSGRTARTDAEGRYLIREIDTGNTVVNTAHDDYHPANAEVVAEGPGKVELDIAIDPITTGIVVGTAVDKTTGEALANVRVTIGGQTVTTDAAGRFRIEDIEAGSLSVQAGSDGFRPASNLIALDARSTAETQLELEPITEGALSGVVRHAGTGTPIAGSRVQVGQVDVTTDADGRFGIAEVAQGWATVTARMPLFEPGSENVEIVALQESEVVVELVPITYGDLVLVVTDATTGAPLSDALVAVPGGRSAKTGSDGRVRFDKLDAGSGLLSASLHAYRPGELPYDLEPGTELERSIALEPITVGTLTGTIISSATGQPLPGADITVGSQGTTSDAGGAFRIDGIAAGPVSVTARKAVFEAGSLAADIVAAETIDVTLALDPITYGTIRGTVVDASNDMPLDGVRISVSSASTRTAADGSFELLNVPAGNQLLAANKTVYEQWDDAFELAPATVETRRIALEPITWGNLQGRVVDADTGAPLANANVVLGRTRVTTDAEGQFGPERVDAGPFTISASQARYQSGGQTVDVAAGETTDAVIALEPIRIGDVTGVVLDARTGEPVDGARVAFRGETVETAADGRFRFDDVEAGSVGVSVRHADYGNGAASGELEGGATLELVVRVDLRREDVTQLEAGLAAEGSIDLYGIHFDSGRDQFKPSSLGTLNAVLEVMKRSPNTSYVIIGHTDSDGGDASNQDLSERRAATVIAWLVERGIEARRLSGRGLGESSPTASNDTESGKALNRRVELAVAD